MHLSCGVSVRVWLRGGSMQLLLSGVYDAYARMMYSVFTMGAATLSGQMLSIPAVLLRRLSHHLHIYIYTYHWQMI